MNGKRFHGHTDASTYTGVQLQVMLRGKIYLKFVTDLGFTSRNCRNRAQLLSHNDPTPSDNLQVVSRASSSRIMAAYEAVKRSLH